METMSAPSAFAHSMASMIPESAPEPSSLRTLPTSRSAAGATPLFAPSDAAPDPAMVEATCVPWPFLSSTSSPGMKLRVPTRRSLTSGWSASMPVSRTATLVPLPSKPAAHASGAFTWGTDSASSASERPSSQSFAMPLSSERAPGVRVMASQKVRAPSLSALSAAPWMEARVRTFFAPRGAAGQGLGAGGRVGGDDRYGAGALVVVPHPDQGRDVEQPPVQGARRDQRGGLCRAGRTRPRPPADADAAARAVGAVHGDGVPVAGAVHVPHDVTGDQGDGVALGGDAGARGLGARRGAAPAVPAPAKEDEHAAQEGSRGRQEQGSASWAGGSRPAGNGGGEEVMQLIYRLIRGDRCVPGGREAAVR